MYDDINTHKVLFNRLSTYLALIMIIGSFFVPVEGFGFEVCYIKGMTGIQCPGCGLTRSISGITHLEFQSAFNMHPFGFVIYPLLLLLGAYNFLPKGKKKKIRTYMEGKNTNLSRIYLSLIYSFIAFGAARILLSVLTRSFHIIPF